MNHKVVTGFVGGGGLTLKRNLQVQENLWKSSSAQTGSPSHCRRDAMATSPGSCVWAEGGPQHPSSRCVCSCGLQGAAFLVNPRVTVSVESHMFLPATQSSSTPKSLHKEGKLNKFIRGGGRCVETSAKPTPL